MYFLPFGLIEKLGKGDTTTSFPRESRQLACVATPASGGAVCAVRTHANVGLGRAGE